MRLAPVDILAPRLLDFSTSDDVKEMALGTLIVAAGTDYDTTANVANWGICELVYVSNNSVAITPGTVIALDKNFRALATAAAASEINKARPLFIALTNFAVGSTTEQYGWALRSGICPVQFSVAATAGAVYFGTAGKLTPTATNGGQILNAVTLIAGASTFTRSGTTRSGSSIVKFPNVGGMYVGQAISGTGIPASWVISAIGSNGLDVYIGSAIGTLVTATASGTVTVTLTNTNYGIVQVDRPVGQSQAA